MIGVVARLTVNANVMLSRYDGRAAFGDCLAGRPDVRLMQKV
ncbi:MAG: hypothetical protein ACREUF_18690 [Solimonas sp.]